MKHETHEPDVTKSVTKSLPESNHPQERRQKSKVGFVQSGIVAVFGLMVVTLMVFGGDMFNRGSQAVAAEGHSSNIKVLELFTSHGCYSCPPADELLGELIKSDPDIIALEFHVDYWDKLIHGSDGSFKDPYSNPEYTLRQHAYNQQRLEGRRGVYTPQMVVNGRYVAVGSQGRYIKHGLESIKRPVVDLSVTTDSTADAARTNLLITVDNSAGHDIPQDAYVWLAVFDVETTTKITGGENNRKTLVNHHVVRQFEPIQTSNGPGALRDGALTLELETDVALEKGQGCAVVFQRTSPGPIYGAAYCPDEMWRAAG